VCTPIVVIVVCVSSCL